MLRDRGVALPDVGRCGKYRTHTGNLRVGQPMDALQFGEQGFILFLQRFRAGPGIAAKHYDNNDRNVPESTHIASTLKTTNSK